MKERFVPEDAFGSIFPDGSDVESILGAYKKGANGHGVPPSPNSRLEMPTDIFGGNPLFDPELGYSIDNMYRGNESSDRKKCPACGHYNNQGANFCVQCRYNFSGEQQNKGDYRRQRGNTRPSADTTEFRDSNKNTPSQKYLDILGLPKSFTLKELKSAYRKKSLEYHPDRLKMDPDIATELFLKLKEAYEHLLSYVKE